MLFVWMWLCGCSGTGVKFRELGRSEFLVSIVRVLGIELRSFDLAADASPHPQVLCKLICKENED